MNKIPNGILCFTFPYEKYFKATMGLHFIEIGISPLIFFHCNIFLFIKYHLSVSNP